MADTANTGIKEVDDVAPIKKGDGEKLAKEQIARFEELQSKRKAERDDDWQTIAQYALPQESDITQSKTEGVSGWTDRIFDTTTIQAVETLSAGLYNWWTPPNQPWNQYELPEELKEMKIAKLAWVLHCIYYCFYH